MMPKITLEQWAAFKAIVDAGSFVKAAELLNKSQSTVSYSLARMEERLPQALFEQAGRKAEVTEFGRSMYRHACHLLDHANQIDQAAQYLASGWQSEVVIAVDALASMDSIFCALHDFSKESPNTRIRLLETTLSGTEEALLRREADIVIGARVPPGFLAENYGTITKTLVVSPMHALAKNLTGELLTEDSLKSHRQIVVRDSGTRRNRDAGWLQSEQRWTVSHFASSIAAIKAGLGFGFIPREKITNALTSGELIAVQLEYGQTEQLSLYLILSAQSHAGLATKAVAKHLLQGAPAISCE